MVAMNVWPTDAADGSVATESRWRKMARQWIPSGVIAGIGGQLAPTLAYPNLTVQAGAVWIDGHYGDLPGAQVLAVTPNGLAVVRFDPAANTCELLYRDGVVNPSQTVDGTWELAVAQLSGSALIDRRGNVIAPGIAGTLYIGNVPAGNVPAGGQITVASVVVPAGLYLVNYVVFMASTAALNNVSIKVFGNGVGAVNYSLPNATGMTSGSFGINEYVNMPTAGTIAVNIVNLTGAQVGTYADSSNHQLSALRVRSV